jgi:hypothetical protein
LVWNRDVGTLVHYQYHKKIGLKLIHMHFKNKNRSETEIAEGKYLRYFLNCSEMVSFRYCEWKILAVFLKQLKPVSFQYVEYSNVINRYYGKNQYKSIIIGITPVKFCTEKYRIIIFRFYHFCIEVFDIFNIILIR